MFLTLNEDDLGVRQEGKITAIINSDFIVGIEPSGDDNKITILMTDGENKLKQIKRTGTMDEAVIWIGREGIKKMEE